MNSVGNDVWQENQLYLIYEMRGERVCHDKTDHTWNKNLKLNEKVRKKLIILSLIFRTGPSF